MHLDSVSLVEDLGFRDTGHADGGYEVCGHRGEFVVSCGKVVTKE